MTIHRSLLLAAVATFAAAPAFAQDGLPPPTTGDAVYGGFFGGGSLGPAYGGSYGGAVGGSYGGSYGTEGGWTESTSYGPGYANEPVYYDEPAQYDAPPPPADDYLYESDAGADYAGDYHDDYRDEPAYAPPPAHAGPPPVYRSAYPQAAPVYGAPPQGPRMGYSPEQRTDWLRQCRARYGRDNDGGLGGALIGGVVGGVVGNRVAGKGHRTFGTVVGAGVGALAGAAIDRGEDRSRAQDECEDYLNRYEAYYAGGGYGAGYGGYGQNVIYVPMIVGWDCKPRKAKVVEEWVEQAPARRVIYTKRPPAKVIYTKTVKTTKPTKYSK